MSKPIECDLFVIGMGMAGMASALFAANRGISTVQAGLTGETIFASGLLDLIYTQAVYEQKSCCNPWKKIVTLCREAPKHPYCRISEQDIRAAFDEFLSFLEDGGLSYHTNGEYNSKMITPLGTIKQTYGVPHTMWTGVQALKKKRPCLIVDFHGLKGFSARQIRAILKDTWPDLRATRISFPNTTHVAEFFSGEITAQALELSKNREKLAQAVRPHLEDARAVGMPAILGMSNTREILAELDEQIGVPVFEIPTMPVSVPGLRLNNVFSRGLLSKGVQRFSQNRVFEVNAGIDSDFVLGIGNTSGAEHTVRAKGIILASGRFWGGGLYADRKHIRETIFHLPVHQPTNRNTWHRKDLMDPRGHPVNRAGLEIDDSFRPLDSSGRPAFQMLFAAGSILANQDWIRMNCGSGLAIATAYAAVNAFFKLRG